MRNALQLTSSPPSASPTASLMRLLQHKLSLLAQGQSLAADPRAAPHAPAAARPR